MSKTMQAIESVGLGDLGWVRDEHSGDGYGFFVKGGDADDLDTLIAKLKSAGLVVAVAGSWVWASLWAETTKAPKDGTVLQANMAALGAVCVVAKLTPSGAVLHARDESGSFASFFVERFGSPAITSFKLADRLRGARGDLKWDLDNANPRRRNLNTITQARAESEAKNMLSAVKVRVAEISREAREDSRLRWTQREAVRYQTVCAVVELRRVMAANVDTDPFDQIALAASRLCAIEGVKYAEEHPWDVVPDDLREKSDPGITNFVATGVIDYERPE